MINFKLLFPRSIVISCMRPFSSSRNRIGIHFRRELYLSRPKPLSNGILNIQDIIRSKYGFKIMQFPPRYYNTYNVNIGFNTNFLVLSFIFNL